MKSQLTFPIRSGLILVLTSVQLFATDWSVDSPTQNEEFSPSSDIYVHGYGPQSTAATAKLVLITTGVTQDSFGIMTNDEEASFSGYFDINGSWPVGYHTIDIWVGANKVYGDQQGDINVIIADNP